MAASIVFPSTKISLKWERKIGDTPFGDEVTKGDSPSSLETPPSPKEASKQASEQIFPNYFSDQILSAQSQFKMETVLQGRADSSLLT